MRCHRPLPESGVSIGLLPNVPTLEHATRGDKSV